MLRVAARAAALARQQLSRAWPPALCALPSPAPPTLAACSAARLLHCGACSRPLLPPAAAALAAAGAPRGISVIVDGNNLDKAARMLKRKMIESGTLRLLKERQVYRKPSEERVRERARRSRRDRASRATLGGARRRSRRPAVTAAAWSRRRRRRSKTLLHECLSLTLFPG
jgi:ribosomal protein S21